MTKEEFITKCKKYLENQVKFIDTDYTYHDDFLMDYPENINGEDTYEIFLDVVGSSKITVSWD